MKKLLIFTYLLCVFGLVAQSAKKDHRVIVIMTDGLRWQEVYKGMDSVIAKRKSTTTAIALKFSRNIGLLRPKSAERN